MSYTSFPSRNALHWHKAAQSRDGGAALTGAVEDEALVESEVASPQGGSIFKPFILLSVPKSLAQSYWSEALSYLMGVS